MISNITYDTDAARLTDVSATTRAFFGPLAIISVVILAGTAAPLVSLSLDGESESQGLFLLYGTLITNLPTAILAPLTVVMLDWLSRQPWRKVSRGFDFLYAFSWQIIRLILIVGGGISVVAFFLGLAAGNFTLDETWDAIDSLLDSLEYWPIWLTEVGWRGLSIGFAIFLLLQQARVEPYLAGPTRRSVLLGDIAGSGYGARLAYVSGLPASMWSRRSFRRPSFWCFIVARPLFAAGILLLVLGLQIHSMPLRTGIGLGQSTGLTPIPLAQLLPIWCFALLLLAAGHIAFFSGKRLASREMWTGAMVDPDAKPPILFLRSFEDDQLSFPSSRWNLFRRWYDLWSFRRNVDEIMVDEFAHYGPVVALGKPSENSPPFGAARYYSDHDDWQEIIRETAKQAQMLVVAAGTTPGLKWEYELIRTKDYLRKSLILFPPEASGATEHREQALQVFRDAFPDIAVPDVPPSQTLVALSVLPSGTVRYFLTDGPAVAQAFLIALRRFVQEQIYNVHDPIGHPVRALVRVSKRLSTWLGLLPWLIMYLLLVTTLGGVNLGQMIEGFL